MWEQKHWFLTVPRLKIIIFLSSSESAHAPIIIHMAWRNCLESAAGAPSPLAIKWITLEILPLADPMQIKENVYATRPSFRMS